MVFDYVPEHLRISKEEQDCKDNFKRHYFPDSSDTFLLKTFKDSPSRLGSIKELDMQRAHSLEIEISKQKSTNEFYQKFMKEYSEVDNMKRIFK